MSATLVTPKTTSGGEIIRELVNASDGAGLHFESGGYIELANSAAAEFGTSDFSVEFVLNQKEANVSSNNIFRYPSSGDNRMFIQHQGGTTKITFRDTSDAVYDLGYDMSTDYGTPTHYVLTADRDGYALLYKNGNQVGSVDISASSSVDIGSGNTGVGAIGSSSANYTMLGTFYRFRTWNKALSSAEVQTAYERADVPFADQYGENNLVDADASAFTSGTYSWVAYGSNTIANVGNALEITYGNAANGAYNYFRNASDLTKDLIVGKKYRLTVDAKYTGGSAGSTLVIGSVGTAFATLTTSMVTYTTEFTATQATTDNLRCGGMSAGNVVTIDNWQLDEIGCVSDYDLAFANPTQSLTVQDRAGSADGTCSASGVTQVQPVVQLNSTAARIGTSAATPADGEVVATSVKAETYRSARSDGDIYIQAATASDFVAIGTQLSSTLLKVDGSGDTTLDGKLKLDDASVAGWIQSNGSVRVDIDNDDSSTDRAFVVSRDNASATLFSVNELGNVLVGAAALDANLGAKKMQLEGSASTSVGPEMLLHNPGQGGGAASLLTFGGKASGTEGYTAAIKATNTGTLTIGTAHASGGFSEPAAALTINSTGDVSYGIGNSKEATIQSTNSGRVEGNPAYSFRGDLDTGMFNPNTDNTLAFSTGGTERMRISSTGLASFSNGVTVSGANNWSHLTSSNDQSLSLADDAQIQLADVEAGAMMIHIYDRGAGHGAVIFATYFGQPELVAGSSTYFDVADTDGKICVIKSSSSHDVYLKNRRGSTKQFSVLVTAGVLDDF